MCVCRWRGVGGGLRGEERGGRELEQWPCLNTGTSSVRIRSSREGLWVNFRILGHLESLFGHQRFQVLVCS